MQSITNCSHVLPRIKSLLVVLQLCIFVCLQSQPETILVESWSPKALPFSTTNWHPTERRKSNQHLQPSPFHKPRISISLYGSIYDDDDDDDADDNSGGTESKDDEEAQFIEVESLSASQVTELIELSFFQACFALSKGDLEPLKLFIIAVITASKKYQGASAMALARTVDSLPPSMRPLDTMERDLRETWIRAVFLMMGHVLEGFDDGSSSGDDDEVANTYGAILVDLVAIHRTGMGLNVNQFVASRRDMLLPKKNILVLEDGPEDDDLERLSVVTQTINVLFTTLVVLEEEYDDSRDDSVQNEEDLSSASPPTSSTKKTKKKKKGKKTSSGGKGFG